MKAVQKTGPISVLFNMNDPEESGVINAYEAEYKGLVSNPADAQQSMISVSCPEISKEDFGIPLPFPRGAAQHFLLETINKTGEVLDLRGASYSNASREFKEDSGRFEGYGKTSYVEPATLGSLG